MPAFDLARTCLSLDGQGRVARHPVDDAFWATIGAYGAGANHRPV